MLPRSPLVLIPLLLLAGCSSHSAQKATAFSQPAAEAFHPGPCRAVSGAILAVGKDAHALAEGTEPNSDISTRMKQNQDILDATQASLEPALKPLFSKLVVGIGIVRIRTDSNTYEKSLGQALLDDYQAVVTSCTNAPSPAP